MAALTQTIKFNLGGHINHSIYWENLAPIGQGGGEYPDENSPFTKQVVNQFGHEALTLNNLNAALEQFEGYS